MADEAEKLINISLCKMAESRTIRRGGGSLHKHLLISTVLTKARSAYFETWYMDGVVGESTRPMNLNASYREEEFPLDDEDDDDLLDSRDELSPSSGRSSAENMDPTKCASDSKNNSSTIDPRFFVEVESEIELPSDILNCVEKIGDISQHMSFTADESAASISGDLEDQTTRMILSDVVVDILPEKNTEIVLPVPLSYLESKDISDREENNNENSCTDETLGLLGSSMRSYTPNPSKRRRGWGSEDEEDERDSSYDAGTGESLLSSQGFSNELSDKLKRNCISVTNVAKRIRFSPDCEDSEMQSAREKSPRPLPVIIDSKFRTKKSHFEEDDQEDSDNDPFLEDALDQNPFHGDGDHLEHRSHRNDRRVPSASSSGSCSDEDGEAENCMEVDQITNLVQFISFGKHQSTLLHVTSSSIHSSSSVVTTSASTVSTPGLVRSMSSPDVRGLSTSSSKVSVSSNSANIAKDLFSYHVSNSNSSQMSHRVLTTA